MQDTFDWRRMSDFAAERRMASLADQLSQYLESHGRKTPSCDEDRLREFEFVYLAMRHLTQDMDADVSYRLYDPKGKTRSVSVVSDGFEFGNTKLFARAVEFASEVQTYAMSNGKVKLVFWFEGSSIV